MRIFSLVVILLMACDASAPGPDGDENVSSDGEEGEDYAPYDSSDKADGFEPPDGPLVFDGACTEGDHLVIAAVGDVLLHGRLQRQAFSEYDRYISLWRPVVDLLRMADVTYANFEGPAAEGVNSSGRSVTDPGEVFDDYVYTSYPMFNYHPSLIDDLMASGVDVVSTSNNHSLDRRSLGADRTLDALDERGMVHTGTRRAGATDETWYGITRNGGFNIAWLACSYGTNGMPDNADQVLSCFGDSSTIESTISDLAALDDIDAVIVTPHWGDEYDANPNDPEVDLAHRFLDAGAIAIIGSHPHVLQPWERYVTADGRETFAIYSLGNFVSGQTHLPRRSTLLLYLGLTRTQAGQVIVNGARYVPLHMSRRSIMQLEAVDLMSDLADSRSLTVGMFGQWNVHTPTAPLSTEPQCDPEWEPPAAPHPHDGWIGGSCVDDGTCGGVSCLTELLDGFCSQSCDGICPDRTGRAITFCVDLDVGDAGHCVARCGADYECRRGYICAPRERYNDPGVVRTVCVPENDA